MSQPTIAQYLNAEMAYGASFAPDGQHIAFLSNMTGVPQVWRVAVPEPGGDPLWPDRLSFSSDRVLGVWYAPVSGKERLVYAQDLGGNEKAQLFMLSPGQSQAICMTEGHEEAMHIFGEWSADGEQILYAANRRHRGLFDLYVQSIDEPAQMVWQNEQPGYLREASFSPDGQRAVVVRMSSSFHHELFEVDLIDRTVRRLLGTDEDVRFQGCCYAAGGDALYLITDLDADFLYVARLDLESGNLTTLAAPDWDCEALCLSPDRTRVAFAVNVEGAREIHLLDLETLTSRTAPTGESAPGQLSDGQLVFAPDGTCLAFSFISAVRTADIYLWDLENDEIAPATRSSHGGIPVETFVGPQLVHYATFDADVRGAVRQIPAWFYRPSTDIPRPLPVVVVVHGGPEGQYSPGFHAVYQYLLRRGYAVFAPNVRGSTGYGKAYSHLDDVEKRMDSVADLAHAVYWLCEQPDVDPDRIVVYGGSYGGFMVLSAITTYPDLWAAAVDIVGISNFVTFLEHTSDYRRGHREAEYGSLARDRTFLESIAPIHNVDRIVAPLIVIHGANDPRVPLSEAEQLVEAVRGRDVPVEFLVFDDEGHGLVKLQNKVTAYEAVVAFLDRHVGG